MQMFVINKIFKKNVILAHRIRYLGLGRRRRVFAEGLLLGIQYAKHRTPFADLVPRRYVILFVTHHAMIVLSITKNRKIHFAYSRRRTMQIAKLHHYIRYITKIALSADENDSGIRCDARRRSSSAISGRRRVRRDE